MFNFLKPLYPFLLLIFSVLVNNYYGSIGVFPVDSFAFFDSAYSINHGNVPFRDYWVMNGPIIDLIQSVFFNFFGTNWTAYLLHSSFINAFFAITTYFFLKHLGLDSHKSLFYSILVSILAYPSVGVPFPDHHSIIFSIIGFYVLSFATSNKNIIYWFILPIPFFVAFFSKQVPAVYFFSILVLYFIFYFLKKERTKQLIALLGSSVILIFLLLLYLNINKIHIEDFIIQYFLFPQTIGQHRVNNLDLNFYLFKLINDFKFINFALFLYSAVVIKKYLINRNKFKLISFLNFVLFLSIIYISITHQILTKNQNFIFFLIPIILGVTHSELLNKEKKYKFFIYFLLILSVLTTVKYHLRFNIDRKLMELENIDKSKFKNAERLSQNLKGLKWVTSEPSGNVEKKIELLLTSINYLKNDNQKKIILTEYQFILAEIDYKIYSPNRWYTTDGVSYPLNGNKYFDYYKKFYKNALSRNEIDTIFTIKPMNVEDIRFLFEKNCIKTSKINKILYEHNIKNCF